MVIPSGASVLHFVLLAEVSIEVHNRRGIEGSGIDDGIDGIIEFRVEVAECGLRIVIESVQCHIDGSLTRLEDGEGLDDVFQSSGRDDFVDSTLAECSADHVCPFSETTSEILILETEAFHLLKKNLLLCTLRSIFLLKSPVESIEHGFVHDVGSCEPTIIGALALSVRSGEDRESSSRGDEFVDLLKVDAFTLKNRLKAHHKMRTKVDLIEEENRATSHCVDYGSVLPNGLTIDQAKTTE